MKRNISLKALLFLCLVTISINLFSQTTYEINPEILNQIGQRTFERSFYQVETKDVDYYPIVDTQVYSDYYQRLMNDLKNLQSHYDEFIQNQTKDSLNRIKEIQIKENIISYLSTKNKALLDDAQKLAEEMNFDFHIKSTNIHVENKHVYIKKGKKYASDKILKDYLNILEQRSIKYRPIQPNNQVKEYINTKQQIESFPEDKKFKIVKEQSKTKSQKKSYFVTNEIDANTLNGIFKEIYNRVYVTSKQNDKHLLNEITEEYDGIIYVWEDYYVLLQNTENQNHYIVRPHIINGLANKQKFENLRHQLENLGYQTEYVGSGYLVVRTKNYLVGNLKILIDDFSNAQKWLTQLEENYVQLQSSITKSNDYKTKLEKYIQLHKVQRNRMSSSDISAWTKVTNEAIQIAEKMFNQRYESGGIPLTIEFLKEPQYVEEFNYNLSYSRNVLGL